MDWLTIVSALVQLALVLVKWLEGRQQLAEDSAAQMKALLEQVNAIANSSRAARAAVDDSPAAIVSDPYNLDGPAPGHGTASESTAPKQPDDPGVKP